MKGLLSCVYLKCVREDGPGGKGLGGGGGGGGGG